MLKTLHITNYTIIDEVLIEFQQGLNVITGETGAGKSILIGALNLLTGARADHTVLFNKEQKCIIEGSFDVAAEAFEDLLNSWDVDAVFPIILRRELQTSGRSRAFINDSPVSLQQLKTLGSSLVQIHEQFATIALFNSSHQLEIYDQVAGLQQTRNRFQKDFQAYQDILQQIKTVDAQLEQARQEADFLQFQHQELAALNLDLSKDQHIAQQLQLMEHGQEISATLQAFEHALQTSDANLIAQLRMQLSKLEKLRKFQPQLQQLVERLTSIIIELEDLAETASDMDGSIELEAEALAALQQRHDALQHMLFKHRLQDVSELISKEQDLAQRMFNFEDLEAQRANLQKQSEAQYAQLMQQAEQMHTQRLKSKPSFEQEVNTQLHALAMPKAQFQVQLESKELGLTGIDALQFQIRTNPGSPMSNLKDGISGGELSRLQLAIQSVIGQDNKNTSLVFDEIDTGVSGSTAVKMADMLRQLGQHQQIIVITHAPQVAAAGDSHHYVHKIFTDKRSLTDIRPLNAKERMEKIAVMLSSDPPSKAALTNAKELLKNLN